MPTVICKGKERCTLRQGMHCDAEVIEIQVCDSMDQNALDSGTTVQCLKEKCFYKGSTGLCMAGEIQLEGGCPIRDTDV